METTENRNLWVYDIETLKGLFTLIAINPDTKEVKKFIIHQTKNDYLEMIKFLRNCHAMIGFNNLDFDYPIIHNLLTGEEDYKDYSAEELIDIIYNLAQDIISNQSHGDNRFNGYSVPEWKHIIPQLDLYKLWHFNNKARRTSLKALEISMNFPNVMEMSIPHNQEEISEKEIEEVLEYNQNDVEATLEFYNRSSEKIKLRKGLNKKYKLNCRNFSDSKIGESLVLSLYCQKTGKEPRNVKVMRTNREYIKLIDCIFPYIRFNTLPFKNLLNEFRSQAIKETKNAINKSVVYKGFKYDFGTGGIHGCIKAGVYEASDDYVIIDADAASLYPSIAVINRLYPEHLGTEFCDVYENDIVKPRLAAKKAGDMTMADGFKLSANSVYGKSNDEHSFLKDTMYTMKTTINGELMLAMLAEAIVERIKDVTMLQINTDGLTVKIKKEDLEKYYDICKEWEGDTKLTLEYVEYSKMVIRDVNNYLSIKKDGKVKYKGAFEIDKDYHKDNSFRVVPFALSEFFVNGIPVEETIKSHKNIYDFCGRQKFIGETYGITTNIKKNIQWVVTRENYKEYAYKEDYREFYGNSWLKKGLSDRCAMSDDDMFQYLHSKYNISIEYLDKEKQQKNVRYYISNKGASFIKIYKDKSTEVINKGFQVTVFNKYYSANMEDYKINYDFYIREAYKEIDTIIDKQLNLF